MKTYVLMLAKVFPKGHPKAGQPTGFKEKFLKGEKIHTIRHNAGLWSKRIKEVALGYAKLSIRQWSGLPYRSKQEILKELTYKDDVGCEGINLVMFNTDKYTDLMPITAKNDGLSLQDWKDWFKYDLSASTDRKLLIIIHFTNFRYIEKYGR